MRRRWPFLLYGAVVIGNVVGILVAQQEDRTVLKALLMPALLVGVLIVAFRYDRSALASIRSRWMLTLLGLAILLSWVGDVGFVYSLEVGVVSFAFAHLAYIGLFVGPARARTLPWWSIPYALVYTPLIGVLWNHLGGWGTYIAPYGLVLLAMAVTSLGVGRIAAVGGLVFLVSETLLSFRMFVPEWLAWFPDPFQDATILLLYCLGQLLLAVGVVGRLEAEPELAAARAARRDAAATLRSDAVG